MYTDSWTLQKNCEWYIGPVNVCASLSAIDYTHPIMILHKYYKTSTREYDGYRKPKLKFIGNKNYSPRVNTLHTQFRLIDKIGRR